MAMATIGGTLRIYLNQWVKIASGNRVTLHGGVDLGQGYVNTGYFVFKCSQCQDNWHVGHDNFPNGNTVPSVLSDWVKKHRHVCKKFRNPPATAISTGICQSCMWPYGAHEESWMGVPGYDHTVTKSFLASLDQKNFPPKPADESMTLKQFTGRKFRDVEAECESPDTNTKKTSNG
jgi:hypothetical protein